MKYLILTCLMSVSVILGSDQEALIVDIEQSLMSPCCWSGTIYDHGNGKLEKEIEDFVKSGKSKQEIMDYYAGIYGERILASPIATGFNLFAWIAPILIAGIGIFVVIIFIRTPGKEKVKIASMPQDNPYDDIIEKELKELD